MACAQLRARDLRDSEMALAEGLEAIDEAASRGADLVVLPECTYPAYVLAEDPGAPPARPEGEVITRFAEAARRGRLAVAVGMARRSPAARGPARNEVLLFDRDGRVVLSTAKRFRWDFDSVWFEPGTASPVASLAGATVGTLVCADARLPEIARSLAVQGSRLILDPTAWVSTGRHASSLSNPQPDFLIRIRALENGTWIAAANKVGVERGAVVYCGRSGLFAPDGTVTASAGPTDPEVVVADLDLGAATGPPVPRRPELYGALAAPTESLPVTARTAVPLVPDRSLHRVVLVQSVLPEPHSLAADLGARRSLMAAFRTELVAAAAAAGSPEDLAGPARSLREHLGGVDVALGSVEADGRVTGAIFVRGDGTTMARTTHGPVRVGSDRLEDHVIDAGELRIGLLLGSEGLVPEAVRVLALQGPELLLWFADSDTPMPEAVARTRALEQRVFVGLVLPIGLSLLADPEGRVAAAGLEGSEQLVVGTVNLAAARSKQMAPSTDVVRDRQPETYGVLTAPEPRSSRTADA